MRIILVNQYQLKLHLHGLNLALQIQYSFTLNTNSLNEQQWGKWETHFVQIYYHSYTRAVYLQHLQKSTQTYHKKCIDAYKKHTHNIKIIICTQKEFPNRPTIYYKILFAISNVV